MSNNQKIQEDLKELLPLSPEELDAITTAQEDLKELLPLSPEEIEFLTLVRKFDFEEQCNIYDYLDAITTAAEKLDIEPIFSKKMYEKGIELKAAVGR